MASLPFHDTEHAEVQAKASLGHRKAASVTPAAPDVSYAAKRPVAPLPAVIETICARTHEDGPHSGRAAAAAAIRQKSKSGQNSSPR